MTWAVIKPASFGVSFPCGGYPEYDEAVRTYYENEMTAEEKEKMGMLDELNMYQVVQKFKNDMGWLADFEQPKMFQTSKTYKRLNSLILMMDGLAAVDEALKKIIEEVEPGVHQFWPIDIVMPKGQRYPVQYYGMAIQTYLDSFRLEKCDPGLAEDISVHGHTRYKILAHKNKKDFKGLAMSREVIGDHHLWREIYLNRYWMFFSDELAALINEAGLKIATHYRMKDV